MKTSAVVRGRAIVRERFTVRGRSVVRQRLEVSGVEEGRVMVLFSFYSFLLRGLMAPEEENFLRVQGLGGALKEAVAG